MANYFKSVFKNFVIWTFAVNLWTLMRQYGQEVIGGPSFNSWQDWLYVNTFMGAMAGVIFGSLDHFIKDSLGKKYHFGLTILINSLISLVIFVVMIMIGVKIFNDVQNIETSKNDILTFMTSEENGLVLFYCYLVSFIASFVKQVDRKFGPGNLYRILIGKYARPQEVERVFMFLDLTSSTTIAEKIGHFKYSQLLQDCFYDLKVIEKYKAAIYQYVGDEVVLTWERKHAVANNNCVAAFFAYKQRILDRKTYYEQKYGVVPSFKAGMNFGKIIIAEVGDVKREIAYHGDTINVASRIQEQCKKLKRELLISESLLNILDLEREYQCSFIDEVILKGKQTSSKLFTVEES